MVPISALARLDGAGGRGPGGPPTSVSVPGAVASLIWLETWRKSEKPLNWTRLSIVVRIIGLSVLVSGSVAVHETVIVTVFWLNETRSIPCTVALRDTVVSRGSTWKLALVRLPAKMRVGIWVVGSVMRTSNVTKTP